MQKYMSYLSLLVSILLIQSCCLVEFFHNDSNKSNIVVGKYDDTILDIAYSSLNDGYPINTFEHFEAAIGFGFNSLKTDIRLTGDNNLVLCHDAGFVLNEDGKIVSFKANGKKLLIDNMTANEIVSLEHASSTKGNKYHPVLAIDYFSLCKDKSIIPYVTIRNEKVEETIDILFKMLISKNMLDDVIINVFPPSVSTCDYIRRISNSVYISYTVGEGEPVSTGLINYVSSLGNAFLCVHKKHLINLSDEMWSYADRRGVKILGWGISDKEEYQSLIRHGCRGGQIVKKEVIL